MGGDSLQGESQRKIWSWHSWSMAWGCAPSKVAPQNRRHLVGMLLLAPCPPALLVCSTRWGLLGPTGRGGGAGLEASFLLNGCVPRC